MPQIIVDYTANLAPYVEPRRVLGAIHDAMIGTGAFKPSDLKGRTTRLDDYLVGPSPGLPNAAFMHVRISMMTTRPEGFRAEVARLVRDALAIDLAAALSAPDLACEICVDARELRRDFYVKAKSGPRPTSTHHLKGSNDEQT